MNFIEKFIEQKLRRISWKLYSKSENRTKKEEPFLCRNNDVVEIFYLEEDVIAHVDRVKELILNKRGYSYSYEDTLNFLISAMNYGRFQLWLEDMRDAGVKLSLNDKLKHFFEVMNGDQILVFFDIERGMRPLSDYVTSKDVSRKRERKK